MTARMDLDPSEATARIAEAARKRLAADARRRTASHDPEEAQEAWVVVSVLDENEKARAREEHIKELTRAVMFVIEAAVIGNEDGKKIDGLEAVCRIATSFVHSQNALLLDHLDGLFLWDTTEAKAIARAVEADRRGGGLLDDEEVMERCP